MRSRLLPSFHYKICSQNSNRTSICAFRSLLHQKRTLRATMETKNRCTRIGCCACARFQFNSTIKLIRKALCLPSLQRCSLYFPNNSKRRLMGVQKLKSIVRMLCVRLSSLSWQIASEPQSKSEIIMRHVVVFAVQKHCIRIPMIGVKNDEIRAECCAPAHSISRLI